MKKIIWAALVAMLTTSTAMAQSAKEMLAEIEGKYEIDNSGNVTFTKVIDVPGVSKDDLFVRALSYFTYNYGNGESVVQVEDKAEGVIVGKGYFPKAHVGMSLIRTEVDTWHILRVDVKDGRLRAMVTLTEYRITTTPTVGSAPPTIRKSLVSSRFPFVERDPQKTVMSKAFYKSYQQVQNSFAEIEKSVRDGNTGKESSDW